MRADTNDLAEYDSQDGRASSKSEMVDFIAVICSVFKLFDLVGDILSSVLNSNRHFAKKSLGSESDFSYDEGILSSSAWV